MGVSETLVRWALETGSRGGFSVMKSRRGFQRAALQKKIAKRSQVLLPKEAEYRWEGQTREAYWKGGRKRENKWHGAQ